MSKINKTSNKEEQRLLEIPPLSKICSNKLSPLFHSSKLISSKICIFHGSNGNFENRHNPPTLPRLEMWYVSWKLICRCGKVQPNVQRRRYHVEKLTTVEQSRYTIILHFVSIYNK